MACDNWSERISVVVRGWLMTDRVEATAPGKLVLWGEYAVLAGVPAAVMAVNRFAKCTVRPREAGTLLTATGFDMPAMEIKRLASGEVPAEAGLFRAAASALLGDPPANLAIHIDTSEFQNKGAKLGIGSSAAALVVCYGALAALIEEPVDLTRAIEAHHRFQGSGSGLDVAAAVMGGTIRFQKGIAERLDLPEAIELRFIFTGESASTGKKLGSFSAWRERGHTAPLDMLALASHSLFEHADDADAWHRYVDALRHLDLAAGLGIFGTHHNILCELADTFGLLYKPCGAGGGDTGMVLGFDHDGSNARITAFTEAASQRGYLPLDLAGTHHGLEFRK
jgi:phosphomevalonate kinase